VHDGEPPAEYFPTAHVSTHGTKRPESAAYVPAAHGRHPMPVEGPYWPGAQVIQDAPSEYVPAGHGLHDPEPAGETLPTAHTPDTAVRPVAAQYEPAGHREHSAVPVLLVKRPRGHAEQPEEPASSAYCPAEHDEHADAPASEYFPGAHALSQGVARPVNVENVPAPQGKQAPDDVAAVVAE
jgi:hypothetical protein